VKCVDPYAVLFGMGGRFPSEWVAGLTRNMHISVNYNIPGLLFPHFRVHTPHSSKLDSGWLYYCWTFGDIPEGCSYL